MMEQRPPRSCAPMLAELALLLLGCVPSSAPLLPTLPELPKQARVPLMPDSARQPQRPPECSPSCSSDAMLEASRAQSLLMQPQPPASGARSGATQ